MLNQLTGFLRTNEKTLQQGPSAESVITLLKSIDDGTINANTGKQVLEEMVETGKSAKEVIAEKGLGSSSGAIDLETLVKQAMSENPKAMEDLRAGKMKAGGAIVGAVMKKAAGKADPAKVQEVLQKILT